MTSGRAPLEPGLEVERRLIDRGSRVVAGCDEVGRGSLSGPVSVGVVAVDRTTGPVPVGVRDSKLLSPAARERLLPAIGSWALESAVGHASASEVDALGILGALCLAGTRALGALHHTPDAVVLDGNYDWLRRPALPAGFRDDSAAVRLAKLLEAPEAVELHVGGDRTCATVAAASVVAKVTRDALMAGLSLRYPGYGWESNKGYGAPAHLAAIAALGPCEEHRRSWRLPIAAG